jgi:3',5'-cyclic AMP phosphodiesterase CpdA
VTAGTDRRAWILQISDLHLTDTSRPSSPSRALLDSFSAEVRTVVGTDPLILAICGDVTARGNRDGFQIGLRIVTEIAERLNIGKESIVMCPGNHDFESVARGNAFAGFGRLQWQCAARPRSGYRFTQDRSVIVYDVPTLHVLAVNSAYHGDYRYGHVDTSELQKALSDSSLSEPIVMLVHHAFIPREGNTSILRNAYEILQLGLARGVAAFLHGDLHVSSMMLVGPGRRPIIGVGSLLSPWGADYNSQFNLLALGPTGLSAGHLFRWVGDLHAPDGRVGAFTSQQLRFDEDG